ncbi:hypothetical protein MFUL124B02_27695 [Myxococcus fulvus 124B02]|nr:hypothetical protein MFUL124B02_27695 [Myxococcus fulvus 124B02]
MSHMTCKTGVVFMAALAVSACGGAERGNPQDGALPSEAGVAREASPLLVTLLTCPVGSTSTDYSPPLRNTPQNVFTTGMGTLSNCYSLLGAQVTSASSQASGLRPGHSCQELLTVGSPISTITWNTGETSQFVQTQVSTRTEGLNLILVNVGTVRSGKFTGATVVRTLTYLSTDLDACRSPEGLSRLTGTQTLTLTGLP